MANARGRKVRRAEVPQLLDEWERSGEPMSQWCEARGLNWYSLNAFKGRWGPAAGEFAEVVVAEGGGGAPRASGRYRVELDGLVFEVDDDFQADTLQRLIRTVMVAAC